MVFPISAAIIASVIPPIVAAPPAVKGATPCGASAVDITRASEALSAVEFPVHPASATPEASAARTAAAGKGAFACEGRLAVGCIDGNWRGDAFRGRLDECGQCKNSEGSDYDWFLSHTGSNFFKAHWRHSAPFSPVGALATLAA
jgi:hypothetical protein